MIRKSLALALVLAGCSCVSIDAQTASGLSRQAIANRAPLRQNSFNPLPLGAIEPRGWLRNQLQIQADGLTGHLDEFWKDVGDSSGWLGGTGESWERGPYYLDGLLPLAYQLGDKKLIEKSKRWVEWTLTHQTPDGQIGPPSNNDWWPRMVMLKVLEQYGEVTGDSRVIPVMTKYFRFELTNLPARPLSDWGKYRWQDNVYTVLWLYNRTGDKSLLDLARLLHKQGYDWRAQFSDFRYTNKTNREILKKRANGKPPDEAMQTHGVNTAMALKASPLWYLLTGDSGDRAALDVALTKLNKYHGLANGMFSSDEHFAGSDPSQGTELCTVVEEMFSLEEAFSVLGDPLLADRLEKVTYNALPATLSNDMWSHQYDQQPNQISCTRAQRGWSTNGNDSNLFGLAPNFGCCTANLHQGWPKFVSSLWMGTNDGGLVAVAYAPNQLKANVGGVGVTVDEETDYPFRYNIRFKVHPSHTAAFPLTIRIPSWASGGTVSVNGKVTTLAAAGCLLPDGNSITEKKCTADHAFWRVARTWKEGDTVDVHFDAQPRITHWFQNSASFERGPLVFALPINAEWSELKHYAQKSSDWQLTPKEDWNYAVVLSNNGSQQCAPKVQESSVSKTPFDVEHPAVTLRVQGRRLDTWSLQDNSAGPLPISPVKSSRPVRELILIPYGAAKLRITSFPYTAEQSPCQASATLRSSRKGRISSPMRRRKFLVGLSASYALKELAGQTGGQPDTLLPNSYSPGRITNEYSHFLPGEEDALRQVPKVIAIRRGSITAERNGTREEVAAGAYLAGWKLLCSVRMNGTWTAVLERTVTYQGVIVYVTESEGVILRIPKQVGLLSSIRPRQTNTPHGVRFLRQTPFVPGPDVPGDYILNSREDPCYENVAALGAEYVGYSLVADEGAGPLQSLFLAANGSSRQLANQTDARWAPDLVGSFFNPASLLPGEEPSIFTFVEGYSKRTLLNGFLPIAHTGVWNPMSKSGYEVIVVLPRGEKPEPIGLLRASVPDWMAKKLAGNSNLHQSPDGSYFLERYWKTSADGFWEAVAGVANYWQHFFEDQMGVDIPDRWLLDAARAGITLSRCSYRGLAPTYQIGEGAYTKIPERSHALFPVAHYEFIWAHQLWNLTRESDAYFQHYLDNYILPDGNFLYNTQDQVEAPMNVGVLLWNSARAYDYTGDLEALNKRLPALKRMLNYVLERYAYGKAKFPSDDRRHGLIWGSPEADLGAPSNDFPNSHPLYYQNSVWIWRGLKEHSRCLRKAGEASQNRDFAQQSAHLEQVAIEMRTLIKRSLTATINAANGAMRQAKITPFTPDDVTREPKQLSSYENHRFMMDWFTADWGVPALDHGHLLHRHLAGHQIMGLHTDADVCRTSNFMDHGTLAARIREDDYRPFLLTLYSLCCYAADSGNRYSPEDAYLPGGFPGEGNPYQWSAVVNSVLQPSLGLRWLLCYEESNADVCHLQKAAPKHWFARGQVIRVSRCQTRFGAISWETRALDDRKWQISIETLGAFTGKLVVHIHSPLDSQIKTSSKGAVEGGRIVFTGSSFAANQKSVFEVTA